MTSELIDELDDAPWRLGILTDRGGRVHLGALVGAQEHGRAEYIEVLAPAGAKRQAGLDLDLDLEHFVVLVTGQRIAALKRLLERCVADIGLRRQLLSLADLRAAA
jgi:hypothetical protein